ncbi:MAG: (2Fe-2S) ferredoxin domain-containing protein [Acidobacteriota bacterium]
MCQILVCTNERPDHASKPSCGPRGGLEVYRKFKDIVRERGVRNEVMVNRTGCLKHCSQGITVAIQPRNRWYAGVTLDDVEEVVDRSACSNEIIERLVMPDIPWE